jgi:hypothetical protein
VKNLETVTEDKAKIEETIAELDRYKRDALQKTWDKVSKYVIFPISSPRGFLMQSRQGFR